jgi:predicted dehydrogenase
MRKPSRREFLTQTGIAAGLAVGMSGRSFAQAGPNDRLRVAVIGVRGQGGFHARLWAAMPDVEIVALCDVDDKAAGATAAEVEKKTGRKARLEKDVRKLLEDKSIDAVSIATPNHWHVLASIWAIQAGKDVYVEKPVSHTVWEGRQLVEAARKHGKLVQNGTYTRSNTAVRDAMEFLRAGKLGAVKLVRARCTRERQSIGTFADGPTPPGVDYDLWLGPAPAKPFNKNRFHYNWHWNWDYGNGEIGNNGVYQMDSIVWGLGKKELPRRVLTLGGRFGYDDDGQTPNTQITLLDYGDSVILYEGRGLSSEEPGTKSGNSFECAEGRLAGTTAYAPNGEMIRRFAGGGAHAENFRNFADAVKARKPELLNADILSGHLAAALCHLANISYRLGEAKPMDSIKDPFGACGEANDAFARARKHLQDNGIDVAKARIQVGRELVFDPKTETFPNDPEANVLLRREYRKSFEVPEVRS